MAQPWKRGRAMGTWVRGQQRALRGGGGVIGSTMPCDGAWTQENPLGQEKPHPNRRRSPSVPAIPSAVPPPPRPREETERAGVRIAQEPTHDQEDRNTNPTACGGGGVWHDAMV